MTPASRGSYTTFQEFFFLVSKNSTDTGTHRHAKKHTPIYRHNTHEKKYSFLLKFVLVNAKRAEEPHSHLAENLLKETLYPSYSSDRRQIFKIRGGSRTADASKMERFVIIVNGWQSLTVVTKRSILDVATVLDPPLKILKKIINVFFIQVFLEVSKPQ